MEPVNLAAFKARSLRFGESSQRDKERIDALEAKISILEKLAMDENDFNTQLTMILIEVSQFYSVGVTDIRSDRRSPNIVLPRHVTMYLARTLTIFSLPTIGRFLRRDHTTVLAGIIKIGKMRMIDQKLSSNIDEIIARLRLRPMKSLEVPFR